MVTGPTEIVDVDGKNVKEAVKAYLDAEYDVEWLVISEPNSIVHATPENAAKIQAHFEGKDIVVGIGGGTICDLCKYSTYYYDHENPLPLGHRADRAVCKRVLRRFLCHAHKRRKAHRSLALSAYTYN